MYTATITAKFIEHGMLKVDVSFTNGTDQLFERFETNQHQPPGWITERIHARLVDLNSLPSLMSKIKLGPLTDFKQDEYGKKAQLYMKLMDSARAGMISSDFKEILSLRTWLRANFKSEYSVYF